MSITVNADEITEITIDHDVYGSAVDVSIQNQHQNNLLVVKIDDFTVNVHDHVALELLHSLAKHYSYELVDLDEVQP